MKLPRDVSGARLADLLCRKWQYARVHQVGSHIIGARARCCLHLAWRKCAPDFGTETDGA